MQSRANIGRKNSGANEQNAIKCTEWRWPTAARSTPAVAGNAERAKHRQS